MRKSLKFIYTLCLCLLVLGCEGGYGSNAQQHVSNAEKLLDANNHEAALIELKNALLKEPDNSQARWLLGELYITLGDGFSAEKELNKAETLGVEPSAVQPLLAEALLLQGNYSKVLDLGIKPGLSPQSEARLLAFRGMAYIYTGQMDEAQKELDLALEMEPQLLPALIGHARLSAARGDLAQAREQLSIVFNIAENYAPGWSLLGDIERFEGNIQASIDAYSVAIDNRHATIDDLLNRAILYISIKHYADAQADIKAIRNKTGNSIVASYLEGLLMFKQNKYSEAIQAFEEVLSNVNAEIPIMYYPSLFFSGASHFMQGNLESAYVNLTKYDMYSPGYIPVLKMLAWIQLKNGNYEDAKQLAQRVVALEQDDVLTLNLLASALIKNNQVDVGVDYFKQVVELQPDSAPARMNLGLGLIMQGDSSTGMKELEKSQELEPQSTETIVNILLTHTKNGEFDQVLSKAQSYLKQNPNNVDVLSFMGGAYMAKGDSSSASHVFDEIIQIDPNNITANSGLAALALKSKQLEKACDYYRRILEKHPDSLRTLMNLALVEGTLGNEDKMIEALQLAITAAPQAREPRLSLARHYFKKDNHQAVIELLEPLLATNPHDRNLLVMLAQSELITRNYQKSAQHLRTLISLDPDNSGLHYQLSRAYAGQNYTDDYRAELKRVLEIDNSHMRARMDLARLALAEKNVADAKMHIQALRQHNGEVTELIALEGQLALQERNYDQAIVNYQRLYELQRNNMNLLGLEEAYWQKGGYDESLHLMTEWLDEYPNDHMVMLQLANRYLQMKRDQDAIAQYAKLVELSQANPIVLNNLAWLLKDTDPDRSLRYSERANDLAPGKPQLMDTLAMLLSKRDSERALTLIERALDKDPDNTSYLYHKAVILKDAKRYEEALKTVESLLEMSDDFSERQEAKQLQLELSGNYRGSMDTEKFYGAGFLLDTISFSSGSLTDLALG